MNETALNLDALEAMTVGQLRDRYAEVFGEASRSGNRRWLQRRIAWRIQALAEGDLTERARNRAEELARDADIRLRPPADLGCAPESDVRTTSRHMDTNRDERLPIPGSVLTRTFKGAEYKVVVHLTGFEYDGEMYRSLSAVATAITGSHWNGYHFFGLRGPSKGNRRKESS